MVASITSYDAITNKVFAEDWDLDPTGNWEDFRQDDNGNGTWDLDEQRTHNDANEITQIEGSSSLVSHDRAGNMTKIPMPADNADDFDLTYDAWNRLVKVEDGEDTVAEYEYTGDNRRIVKETYEAGELDETRHFYYTDQWQCIEERTEPRCTTIVIEGKLLGQRGFEGTASFEK